MFAYLLYQTTLVRKIRWGRHGSDRTEFLYHGEWESLHHSLRLWNRVWWNPRVMGRRRTNIV